MIYLLGISIKLLRMLLSVCMPLNRERIHRSKKALTKILFGQVGGVERGGGLSPKPQCIAFLTARSLIGSCNLNSFYSDF